MLQFQKKNQLCFRSFYNITKVFTGTSSLKITGWDFLVNEKKQIEANSQSVCQVWSFWQVVVFNFFTSCVLFSALIFFTCLSKPNEEFPFFSLFALKSEQKLWMEKWRFFYMNYLRLVCPGVVKSKIQSSLDQPEKVYNLKTHQLYRSEKRTALKTLLLKKLKLF